MCNASPDAFGRGAAIPAGAGLRRASGGGLLHVPAASWTDSRGTLNITFECDPAEAEELIAATKEELRKLHSGEAAFTEDNVKATKEQERREFEEAFRKNDWWAGTIMDLYFSRCHAVTEDIGVTMELWWQAHSEAVESLDVARAQQVFRRLVPQDGDVAAQSAVITMRPKTGSWWWPFGQGQKPAAGEKKEQ